MSGLVNDAPGPTTDLENGNDVDWIARASQEEAERASLIPKELAVPEKPSMETKIEEPFVEIEEPTFTKSVSSHSGNGHSKLACSDMASLPASSTSPSTTSPR